MSKSNSVLTLARKRAATPTTFERRLGFTVAPDHRVESFSLGVRTRGAPVYDPARNARANPARTYHVETAWDAMLLTAGYSGEPHTFKRWSRS